MERDPILTLGRRIQGLGIASEEQLAAIDEEVKAEVKDAVEFAEQTPPPGVETVAEHVYG
jgi:pyruvate dehydrogenase E1 component alpha subunit